VFRIARVMRNSFRLSSSPRRAPAAYPGRYVEPRSLRVIVVDDERDSVDTLTALDVHVVSNTGAYASHGHSIAAAGGANLGRRDQRCVAGRRVLDCARQQQRAWVFCDTAPLLTAVYSDCVFGDDSQYPHALALHARYTHTLLLEPDIPWVADGLQRDGEAMRATVHARILHCLQDAALPPTCIARDAERRLQDAVADMSHYAEFDCVIVNDDFETAVAQLLGILRGQSGFSAKRPDLAPLLGDLLG